MMRSLDEKLDRVSADIQPAGGAEDRDLLDGWNVKCGIALGQIGA